MVSPPPKTVILRLISYFSQNILRKNSKRMRWTLLEYFLKTIDYIDIVPELKLFLDFSWGVTPFCKNIGS